MKTFILQVIVIISVHHTLLANESDDIRVEDLMDSSKNVLNNSLKANNLANKAIILAVKEGNQESIGKAYLNKGQINRHFLKYRRAIIYYDSATFYFAKAGMESKVADLLRISGRYHYELGEYEDAMEDYMRGLSICRKLNLENDTKAWLLRYVGSVFKREGDQEKALDYYKQAYNAFKNLNDPDGMASSLNNIGNVYGILENDSLQLLYYKKAVQLTEENNLKWRSAIILDNIGAIYAERKDFESALHYFDRSYKYLIELEEPDYTFLSTNFQNRARLSYLDGDYKKALDLIQEAERLILLTEKKRSLELISIYKIYADVFKAQNNFEKAFEYYHKFNELDDSLRNVETAIEIERLELEFSKEQTRLQEVNSKKLNELKYTNQRRTLNWLLLGSVLLLIVSSVIFIQKRKLSILNKNLTDSLEKEKEIGYMKSRFVSTASHQFRTPLTIIKSNVSLLDMHRDSIPESVIPVFDKTRDRVNEQINNMTMLMNQLLLLSKINSGNVKPNMEVANITALCEEVCKDLSDIQEDGRVAIFQSQDQTKELMLDPTLTRQVISNILSNAFKYSQGESPPIVHVFNKENTVQVSIKDNGIGIPEEDISRLFQPFFRASNTDGIMGTGLGISVAKEYIELMGGDLQVFSFENKGSEFIIRFSQDSVASIQP